MTANPGNKYARSMDRAYRRRRYPGALLHAIPRATFSDRTANGLTKCIIHFLKISGHMAWRQSSEGRYDKSLGQ